MFRASYDGIIGYSPVMQILYQKIDIAKSKNSNIFIVYDDEFERDEIIRSICDNKYLSIREYVGGRESTYVVSVKEFSFEEIKKIINGIPYRIIFTVSYTDIIEIDNKILSLIKQKCLPIFVPKLKDRIEDIPLIIGKIIFDNQDIYPDGIRYDNKFYDEICKREWNNFESIRNFVDEIYKSKDNGDDVHFEEKNNDKEEKIEESLFDLSYSDFRNKISELYFKKLLQIENGNIKRVADRSKTARPFVYKKINELNIKPNNFRRKK